MKMILRLIFLFILIISFENCATIFTGSKTTLTINTDPEGAKIQINGVNEGLTPVTVTMKKKIKTNTISLTKEGYESKNIILERKINLISFLNLINVLGWGIDILTGAINNFEPKNYKIKLKQL